MIHCPYESWEPGEVSVDTGQCVITILTDEPLPEDMPKSGPFLGFTQ